MCMRYLLIAGALALLVGAVEEVLGGEVLVGCDWIEAFEQTAVDGGGRFAVQLLIDDALDEGFAAILNREEWLLGRVVSNRHDQVVKLT